MQKRRFNIFLKNSDQWITIALIILMVFGTLMIASAEMGDAQGETSVIVNVIIRQLAYLAIGIGCYLFLSRFSVFKLRRKIFDTLAFVMVAVLLSTRLFGDLGGAYAWIRIGSFTIQPSEFAKVFTIVYFALSLTQNFKDSEEERNKFRRLLYLMLAYTVIIVIWEKDTGSGVILFGIAYLLLMVPKRQALYKYNVRMRLVMLAGIGIIIFVLSPIGTSLLNSLGDNYMISRFTSAADPFADQYSTGYHLVMALVAFATGGLFGVGYGNSVHKYMNFPNPSSDFILVVIVEELGIIGLIILVVLYGIIIIRLARHATNKYADLRAKIVFLGVILYFGLHFILNVGGVSGLIPLTGVPLLLVSSGGSSSLAAMIALGIAQNEIIRIRMIAKEQADA